MPASVQRHNLARLRTQLKLTQGDVAKLVGCSPATIKAVEIGKLALSESLASRISLVLGGQKDWLLENNLDAPIPSVYPPKPEAEKLGHTKECQLILLNELFSRLFSIVAKMEKGSRNRMFTEMSIASELDALKKQAKYPEERRSTPLESNAIEYFVHNPDLLDPGLREWIDLEGLLKSKRKLASFLFLESRSPRRRKVRTPSRKSS
jgi:transcriptional regulator with XRE-family HTH domain